MSKGISSSGLRRNGVISDKDGYHNLLVKLQNENFLLRPSIGYKSDLMGIDVEDYIRYKFVHQKLDTVNLNIYENDAIKKLTDELNELRNVAVNETLYKDSEVWTFSK